MLVVKSFCFSEEEETTSDAWKTEYKYEEHYFLTDPDQLINTHFPDETEWQLLATPWTLTNFEVSKWEYLTSETHIMQNVR